jgi:uncharacterized membrane protein
MNRPSVLAQVVFALLLIAGSATGAVAAEPSTPRIHGATVEGPAVVEITDERVYLWQNESGTISFTFESGANKTFYTFCARVEVADGKMRELACRQQTVKANSSTRIALPFDRFPSGATGRRNVTITATEGFDGSGPPAASALLSSTVMTRQGDLDGDGLTNEQEIAFNTSYETSDTDSDGLNDKSELVNHRSSPLLADTDGDGLRDQQEISAGTNVTIRDSDGDGLLDGREKDMATDPLQKDSDGDGLSDGRELAHKTDPTVADSDDDGLEDGAEVKTFGTDPHKDDSDGDGVPDGKEVELGINPARVDSDGDLLDDGTELNLGTDPSSAGTLLGGLGAALLLIGVLGRWYSRSDAVDLKTLRARIEALRSELMGDEREAERPSAGDRRGESPAPMPLSDDGRVIEMLREAGGQLRQSEIVDRTEWSKSKVSRLLSKMEEDGLITKVNIGRENVITLPDEHPEVSQSTP